MEEKGYTVSKKRRALGRKHKETQVSNVSILLRIQIFYDILDLKVVVKIYILSKLYKTFLFQESVNNILNVLYLRLSVVCTLLRRFLRASIALLHSRIYHVRAHV